MSRAPQRLLPVALGFVAAFVALAAGWVLWQAPRNPDVHAKRPSWVDFALGDLPYWVPLLATLVVGAGLVGGVFWRAMRRARAGEDLFAQRHGRGLRRRGERFSEQPEAE